MEASWTINGDRLCLSIAYQKPNETGSGTSGASCNWQVVIDTTVAETAQSILTSVKKDWNWKAIKGLDDWTKLI
jgi:hypothetical protein